jgi:hypothetical protein
MIGCTNKIRENTGHGDKSIKGIQELKNGG